jgi:restriction system protein
MDFLTAAQRIREQEGNPLHFKEITKRALGQGLISPSGMTPEATMGSRLYVDTKKEESRFERMGRGRFAAKRRSQRDDIANRVEAINDLTRQTLRRRLHEMAADRFEALIGELLIAIGFDESSVQVTSYANDGGIDVRGILNAGGVTAINAAVQVKRWKRNVRTNIVRELRGTLTTHEQGIIITTSDYSAGARTEANAVGKAPISLVNGTELIELLVKHSIGVNKQPHTVIMLDEEWWNEATGEPSFAVDSPVADRATGAADPLQDSLTFPLAVRAVNDPELQGSLISLEGAMQFREVRYRTPSSAGKAASGWKSCNGWRYWQYQHPETKEWRVIDALRRKHDGLRH